MKTEHWNSISIVGIAVAIFFIFARMNEQDRRHREMTDAFVATYKEMKCTCQKP